MGKAFLQQLRNEFRGYNGHKLSQDLMAGLTVAAVALPLALAFGVSAGATAACGLVTAIVAGLVISCLLYTSDHIRLVGRPVNIAHLFGSTFHFMFKTGKFENISRIYNRFR